MYKTSYTKEQIEELLSKAERIFFIGIGGVSMSSLAHISLENGYKVSGSDRTKTALTEKLENDGIKIYYCHDKENIKDADIVVYTAAIPETNPEFAEAREKGIPLVYRADYLGYIMSKYKNRIGVSGMHGKSTVTSMISEIFLKADADPTVVSGAALSKLEGGTYRRGKSDHFIMEACEYCDSFLSFTPNIAVVLNIEMDHPDYFEDINHIKRSFTEYLHIADNGYAVVNWDDMNVRECCKDYKGRLIKVGLTSDGLDFTAKNINTDNGFPEYDLVRGTEIITHVKLSVTGDHNVINSVISAAVADICNISAKDTAAGLYEFTGASRRMEYRGKIFGGRAKLYDDYAHHPTEIRSTLAGAKKAFKNGIWCIYQPHTYSRTAELYDEFIKSFDGVKVIYTDIYAAREVNTTGITSKMLARDTDGAEYIGEFSDIVKYLYDNVKENDTVIVMGAGDIIKLSGMLIDYKG